MKKKLLKIFVIICNLVILGLAVRWLNKDNIYEPVIVIVGQLASLASITFDFSRNLNMVGIKGGTYNITHTGPGDINAKDHENTDLTYKQ